MSKSSVMVGVRVSKSSVMVFDLVTFSLDFVTFLFDLVTFPLDLVTFFSPNRDDKFLCLVIIHKRDIDIFVQCTSDATTYTSVWQQVYSIVKKNILRGIEVPALMSSIVSPFRQCTRTVNLNTIVENEKCEQGFHVQRAMYKAVYRVNSTKLV